MGSDPEDVCSETLAPLDLQQCLLLSFDEPAMLQELFPGFFRPSTEQFRQMWEEGIVAVDANILLHVYRYSPQLREALFLLLEKIGDRLFVPHRAAYEFSKNRLTVISSQEKAYDDMIAALERVGANIAKLPRHSVVNVDDIKSRFDAVVKEQQGVLEELKVKHPPIPDGDPTLARLAAVLENKVGPRSPPEFDQKIIEEGEKRFKAKIPPGFRDAAKDDDPLHKFGDFIVWRQTLDRVREAKAQFLILATDDSSDDWWGRHDGKTFGPHPALVQEAKDTANCSAYLYRGEQFIQFGSQHFGLKMAQNLIDEAATVRKTLTQVLTESGEDPSPMQPFFTTVRGLLPIDEDRAKRFKIYIRLLAKKNPTFEWKFRTDGNFVISFQDTLAFSKAFTEMSEDFGVKILGLGRKMLPRSSA